MAHPLTSSPGRVRLTPHTSETPSAHMSGCVVGPEEDSLVHRHVRPALAAATATALAVGVGGCAGWGGGPSGGGPDTINVLMVNNPQMVDLQQLTAEHFTAETGITVNYTVLPENDVRDKISQEVADIAAELDGVEPGMAGICLRGQPGWGQVFAPLTTVVNTFGGTWFTEDWEPQVDSEEFRTAVQFYVDLVREHGEVGAPQAGFTECLNNLVQGNAAMWYDATSAAGSLEEEGSPVRGKIGYAAAPVVKTDSSGWLYAWSWGIQQASDKKDNAWKFISWASGKDY